MYGEGVMEVMVVKILIGRKYRQNDIQTCNTWFRVHVVENQIERRKQTKNWKETVKWAGNKINKPLPMID